MTPTEIHARLALLAVAALGGASVIAVFVIGLKALMG
jgi:hypothetical protein